ncbi:CHASE3 domain-containing protein [Paucibacter sp. O1-1]|uniref:CHASE3 domain-containing protein n=1 Tax=Paucibacter sp. M5-1 TaxID=3015998 RepID=UPI0010F4A154|nr:CHASE3 domain-containing protein [Paucibacter sp. M5-1]MCU7373417.1 CHASE3 domain-containing protein [Paucibacter sp. O1-1]MCZ7879710.1 CHASE3 domain-containing protein [Paucibacter sp. M5-1]MDA3828417.1 CHASE3 domain-containing protein [Paucibacter sp. O1-1]
MRFTSFPLAAGLLLTGCVAFLATAYGEHRSLGELVAGNAQRVQALQTQLQLRRLGSLLIDLESGQRGFLITGQVAFLAPYESARQELAQAYTQLTAALPPSAETAPTLERLDDFIRQRIEQAEKNVERRWQIGEAALKDLSAYVNGKRLMDDIRAELALLERHQSRMIEDAERRNLAVQQRTALLSAVLPLVGVLLIGGAMLALVLERRQRDRAETALREANTHLESAVAARTADLQAALSRIQSFAVELDRSIEAERSRLAREVHDQLGQLGTASKMLVLALRRKLAPAKEELIDELLAMTDESIAAARQISAALRPPLLDDLGLAAAIGHYAKGLARQGELAVEVEVDDEQLLGPEQRNQLFRILQEAGTNVLRHAQAGRLQIAGRAAGRHYTLEIRDNGNGPGSVRADASGLRNMRERAALAGGRFEFGPAPGGGTRVAVHLPLPAEAQA